MAQQRSEVVVLIGTGSIGQAIARRISTGKILILADSNLDNAELSARSLLQTGFTAVPTTVDVTSRESVQTLCDFAISQGHLTHLIHTASAAPTHTTATDILTVELYGTALILEKFGDVITAGGAGIIVSSHAGHRLPALYAAEDRQLAITPTEKLLNLPMLRYITDPVHAMQIAKRGNTLRVQAAAMTWGARGARINVISPGIIMTPMAREEFSGPAGGNYREMIEKSPAGRAGTPEEIGQLGAYLLSQDANFITGADFLIDGGVTSAWFYGGLQRKHT